VANQGVVDRDRRNGANSTRVTLQESLAVAHHDVLPRQPRGGDFPPFWAVAARRLLGEIGNLILVASGRFGRGPPPRRLFRSQFRPEQPQVLRPLLPTLVCKNYEEANARRFMRFLAWGPPFTPMSKIALISKGLAMKGECGQLTHAKSTDQLKISGCFDEIADSGLLPASAPAHSRQSASTKSSASNSRSPRLRSPTPMKRTGIRS